MSKHGCNLDGSLNAANLAITMPAMGFHSRNFQCKLFSVNSMTLTLLSLATKLPTDLNSPMPSHLDYCTAMANFMPSLATMNDSEIISNIVSLAIFVITVIVDVCLDEYWCDLRIFTRKCNCHGLNSSLNASLLFVQFGCSSHKTLDRPYHLKAEMEKLCAMVHATSPQRVFGSSLMCTAAGFLNFFFSGGCSQIFCSWHSFSLSNIFLYVSNFRGTLLLPSIPFMLRYYAPSVNSVLKEVEKVSVPVNFQNGNSECEIMINEGIKNNPFHLIMLLKKRANDYNSAGFFNGVLEFDSYLVPPITTSDVEIPAPPHCWTLPVVILTSIANSLGQSDERMESLINIEDKSLISVRACSRIFVGRHDYYTFFIDINLHKDLSSRGNFSMTSSPEWILKKLANTGKECVQRSKVKLKEVPHVLWPIEVTIGYNLYRVCESILRDIEKYQTVEKLFDWIEHTISDLLAACLSNLPRALYAHCVLTHISKAEERVKRAAYVLGQHPLDLDRDKMAYLENWHSMKHYKDLTSGHYLS
ncbi:hypothetical protein NE237_033133 [Protea cynaroides]|uniref:Uncharacterized protein n=1 Tax=Protea cynaroides TaxID=273540 RepID=A0A9Q0L6B7_9MAGN|nr:hypothetical protein NE237_033133 [Protea cynaroides]